MTSISPYHVRRAAWIDAPNDVVWKEFTSFDRDAALVRHGPHAHRVRTPSRWNSGDGRRHRWHRAALPWQGPHLRAGRGADLRAALGRLQLGWSDQGHHQTVLDRRRDTRRALPPRLRTTRRPPRRPSRRLRVPLDY